MDDSANIDIVASRLSPELAPGTAFAPGTVNASLAANHDRMPDTNVLARMPAGREAHVAVSPFLGRLLPWVEAVVMLAVTLGVRWDEAGQMDLQRANVQLVADLMGVLGFFHVVHNVQPESLKLFPIGVRRMWRLALPLALAGLLQAAVMLLFGWPEARLLRAVATWLGFAIAGLAVTCYLSGYALRHPTVKRWLTRRIAIVGATPGAFHLAGQIDGDAKNNFQVAGVFVHRAVPDYGPDHGKPAGSITDLIKLSQKASLSGVILVLPRGLRSEVHDLLSETQLRELVADVFVTPYTLYGDEVRPPVEIIGGIPFLVLKRRPMNEWQKFLKRSFDVAASLVLLALLLPLFLLTAAAIKLNSRGPVFFLQPRRGLNNQPFPAYKFRSMYTCTTDLYADIQTSRGDVRVTRVGRWLRKFSIDELPQLLNVLRGEMSMVGPRPHALHTRIDGKLLSDLSPEYLLRYQIKPGITGLAQINGARGELANPEDLTRRLAFDLEYMHRWSLQLDVKIVFLTAFKEIVSKYAY